MFLKIDLTWGDYGLLLLILPKKGLNNIKTNKNKEDSSILNNTPAKVSLRFRFTM